MAQIAPAEQLLQELGVTEPKEIDLEAIAYYVGARIRHRPLNGCEARIVGSGNQAIITVNANSPYRRNRFSIAHELGHWKHHRGTCLVCRAEDDRRRTATSPEHVANKYASDLLLPRYLFRPIARQFPKPTLGNIKTISDEFEVSLTAAAIRYVDEDYASALLVCHSTKGIKWFVRAPSVPARWFPRDDLDAASFAFGILHGNNLADPMPRKIGADAWFSRQEAANFDVFEQSVRSGNDEVLTLLHIRNEEMLEEYEEVHSIWKPRFSR